MCAVFFISEVNNLYYHKSNFLARFGLNKLYGDTAVCGVIMKSAKYILHY